MRRKPIKFPGMSLPFRRGSSGLEESAADSESTSAASSGARGRSSSSNGTNGSQANGGGAAALAQLPGKPSTKNDGTATDPYFLDSERTPSHEGIHIPPLDQRTQRLVNLVDTRFQGSYDSRRVAEKNYQESLAFFRGDQWVEWNAFSGMLRSMMEPGNINRVYSVHNKLRPVAFHIIARALAAEATASFRPMTRRQKDILATRQMRSVWAHVQAVNKWAALWLELISQSVIVGPAYCYTYYDTQAEVPIPKFVPGTENDPEPEIEDIVDAKLGEIKLDFLSTFEVYPEPKARRWENVSYLTIARRVDLEYVKKRWPDEGKYVVPEAGGPGEVVALTNDAITQNQVSRGSQTGLHTVILKIMWEKPSIAYPPRPDEKKTVEVTDPVTGETRTEERTIKHPGGRYLVVAGGRLLEEREWLYPYMKEFPVVPLVYRKGIETVWGDNALAAAIPPQRDYNRALSKIQERSRNGDGKLLVARGSELDPKAFKSELRNETIYYTHTDPRMPAVQNPEPHFIPFPPIDESIIRGAEISDENIKAITSVNDPTLGQTKGDLSGVALNTLQDADQSEGSLYRENQQTAILQIAENVGALAKQFYLPNEARLQFIQDTAPVQSPPVPVPPHPHAPQPSPTASAAGGGLPPGVGGPGGPGPAGEGVMAPPGGPGDTSAPTPPTTGAPSGDEDSPRMEAVVFSHLSEGRWTVDATAAASMSPSARRQVILQMAQAHMFDPQQLPATIVLLGEMELLSGDSVLDDLKAALQMQMAASMPPPPPPPPDPIQQAHLEAATQSIIAGAKAQVQEQVQTAIIQAQTDAKIRLLEAEHALPPKPPSITLAGKLTPAGEVSAEEAAGLDVHAAAAHLHDAASIGADAPVGGAVPYGIPSPQMPLMPPAAQVTPAAAGAPTDATGTGTGAGTAQTPTPQDDTTAPDDGSAGAPPPPLQ